MNSKRFDTHLSFGAFVDLIFCSSCMTAMSSLDADSRIEDADPRHVLARETPRGRYEAPFDGDPPGMYKCPLLPLAFRDFSTGDTLGVPVVSLGQWAFPFIRGSWPLHTVSTSSGSSATWTTICGKPSSWSSMLISFMLLTCC